MDPFQARMSPKIPALLAVFLGGALGGCSTSGPASIDANAGATPPIQIPTAAIDAGVPACNAVYAGLCGAVTPSPPTNEGWGGTGNVTTYTTAPSAGGACGYGTTAIRYFAAMSVNLQSGDGKGAWQGGRICGQCAEVTTQTSQGSRSVVLRIMDKCPDDDCGIDLGGDTAAAIMADGPGRYAGWWQWVSCTGHPEVFDGPLSLWVKDGSNPWWSRIQVRNPPGAVLSMAWRPSGGAAPYQDLVFDEGNLENYYTVPASVLQSANEVDLIIRFSDGTSTTMTISGASLALAGSSFPLP